MPGPGDSKDPPDQGGRGTNVRNRKSKQQPKQESTRAEGTGETPGQNTEPAPTEGQQGTQPQQLNPEEIIYIPANRIILAVPKWLMISVVVVLAVLFIGGGGLAGDYIYKKYWMDSMFGDESMVDTVTAAIGYEAVSLFQTYDRDEDGKLSLSEYEALYHALVGSGFSINATSEEIYAQPIEEGDEMLTAYAEFKPLILGTMTKDLNDKYSNLDPLKSLMTWNKVNKEWLNFGVKHFKAFFPPEDKYITELGTVYNMYKSFAGYFGTNGFSSNRYYPPKVEDDLIILHKLLSMFHSRPFLRNRFPPQGGMACVRAYNDKYLDITFRFHGEFQLNEPPFYPFWFTPGQFTGNLIVSRDYKHILYFHVYVPNDKKLNVDMEWLGGPAEGENMEVDIGYMPQMEIKIKSQSMPFNSELKDLEMIPDAKLPDEVSNIKWTQELSLSEVQRNLEVAMYPFKKVQYHNFTEVFDIAQKEKKLVHSILLWGALDDQSC